MGFANLHALTLRSTPHSTPLVPVFSFGENDLFEQVRNPRGSWLRRVQHRLQKIMGISLPLFHARGIFQYSFGLLPYRRPVYTVGKSFLGQHNTATLSRANGGARDITWVVLLSWMEMPGWSIMLWWARNMLAMKHPQLLMCHTDLDLWLGLKTKPRSPLHQSKAPEHTHPSHDLCGMQPNPAQPSNKNHCNNIGLNFFQANFTSTNRATPKQFAGLLSVLCRHSCNLQPICMARCFQQRLCP